MSKEYEDKEGNSPEVGGFVISPHGGRADIIQINDIIIFISMFPEPGKDEITTNPVVANPFSIAGLIEQGYTFEPKPEEPKKEIPKKGTPVKVMTFGNADNWIVRISAGVLDDDGNLICYPDGKLKGTCSSCGWKVWEVI